MKDFTIVRRALAALSMSLALLVAAPAGSAMARSTPSAKAAWQRHFPVVSKRRAVRIAMRHTKARCLSEGLTSGWACPTDGPGWGLESFQRLAPANMAIVNTWFILMPPPDSGIKHFWHYSCRMTVRRSTLRNKRGEYSGAYHHTHLKCYRQAERL